MVGTFFATLLVSQCSAGSCSTPMVTQNQGYYQVAAPQQVVTAPVVYVQTQPVYARPIRVKLFKRRGCN